ncbi:MAG: DUF5674 family protein [Actinomycetota bacterium]
MTGPFEIQVVTKQQPVLVSELTRRTQLEGSYTELVKSVVDIKQHIMAIGGSLHVDEESLLLQEHGSSQADLWGINLYPDAFGTANFIEYDSMINLRPRQNRSRGVDDPKIRETIEVIVSELVRQ